MGPYADIWIVLGGCLAIAGVVMLAWRVLAREPERPLPQDVRREPQVTPIRPAMATAAAPSPPTAPPPQEAAPQADAEPEPFRKEWDIFDFRTPLPLLVEYCDAQGEVTERLVAVASYHSEMDALPVQPQRMRGHCQLRDASRSFILARVLRAVDARSDEEIIDLPTWLLAQKARRRPRHLDL